MARHKAKDEDHIVFTSNLSKRNPVGACALSSRAPPCIAFPPVAPGNAQGPDRSSFPFADLRLTPHYPAKSPLDNVLLKVVPGADEYLTEKYAFEIMQLLGEWSLALKTAPPALASPGEIPRRFDRSHFAASNSGNRAAFGKRNRDP